MPPNIDRGSTYKSMKKVSGRLALTWNMTRLLRARYLRIVGFAAGAVVVAGAAVVVTASASGMTFGFHPSSSSPAHAGTDSALQASTKSTVCSDFMSHFAVRIGKSQAQINDAYQKAIADTLAGQVANKQLTQAQADAIKKKLASQTPCTIPPVAAPRTGSKATIAAYMAAYESAAASALGITDAQLKTDLAGGQSLSQIAASKNLTEAQFRSALIAKLTPALDAAVKANKLTSPQEQAILKKLQTGTLPLWNTHVKHPKPAAATPTVTPKAA
jgi:hypothetical protein